MSAATHAPIRVSEPSHWLRSRGGEQLRRLRRMGAPLDDPACPLFLAPLVGRLTVRGTQDDRRCDRCGTYCPEPEGFWPGLYAPHPGVMLVLGLCDVHAQAEGVTR